MHVYWGYCITQMTGIHRGDSNMSLSTPGFSSLPALPFFLPWNFHEEFQLWWCSSDSEDLELLRGTWCFSLGLPGERIRSHNFLKDSQSKQLSWWSQCGDWPSIQWGLRTLRFRSLRTKLEFIASQYLPKLRHEIIFMKKTAWLLGHLCPVNLD